MGTNVMPNTEYPPLSAINDDPFAFTFKDRLKLQDIASNKVYITDFTFSGIRSEHLTTILSVNIIANGIKFTLNNIPYDWYCILSYAVTGDQQARQFINKHISNIINNVDPITNN